MPFARGWKQAEGVFLLWLGGEDVFLLVKNGADGKGLFRRGLGHLDQTEELCGGQWRDTGIRGEAPFVVVLPDDEAVILVLFSKDCLDVQEGFNILLHSLEVGDVVLQGQIDGLRILNLKMPVRMAGVGGQEVFRKFIAHEFHGRVRLVFHHLAGL